MCNGKSSGVSHIMKRFLMSLVMFSLLLVMSSGVQAMGVDASSPDLPPHGLYVSNEDFTYSVTGLGTIQLI